MTNTPAPQEIELPPIPVVAMNESMAALLRAYARTAVLADRERREPSLPVGGEPVALERLEFVQAMCREAQDVAAQRGWALNAIVFACDTLDAAKAKARDGLLGKTLSRGLGGEGDGA